MGGNTTYYFKLQWKRLLRWSEDFGLPFPFLAILSLGLFLIGSIMVFYKIEQATWVYLLLAFAFMGAGRRSEAIEKRLRLLYGSSDYLFIKFVEISLKALPFVLFAVYQKEIYLALGILGLGLIQVLFRKKSRAVPVLPTPFKRWAFEFVIGFRKYFLLIMLLYLLIAIAVRVNNANLGLVILGFLSCLSAAFYIPVEPIRIVWQHNLTPNQFLCRKIGYALLCQFLYLIPAIIILAFLFPDFHWAVFIIAMMATLILITVVLAKYSSYPREIGVLQSFIMALSLGLPVLLPFVWWIFFRQSKRRLDVIL